MGYLPSRQAVPGTDVVSSRPGPSHPPGSHQLFRSEQPQPVTQTLLYQNRHHTVSCGHTDTSAPSACRRMAVYTSPSVSVLLTTPNHSDRSGASAWSVKCGVDSAEGGNRREGQHQWRWEADGGVESGNQVRRAVQQGRIRDWEVGRGTLGSKCDYCCGCRCRSRGGGGSTGACPETPR